MKMAFTAKNVQTLRQKRAFLGKGDISGSLSGTNFDHFFKLSTKGNLEVLSIAGRNHVFQNQGKVGKYYISKFIIGSRLTESSPQSLQGSLYIA